MSLFADRTAATPLARQAATPPPAPPPPPRPSYNQEPRREVPADIYDEIEKNKDLSRTYIDEVGNYLLKVIKLSDGFKPKGTKNAGKPFFGADFEIVDSDNTNFQPGSEGSWMSTQNDYPEYHLRSINNLLSSILQVDSSQINKDTVKHAASDENPAVDRLVLLRVTPDPKGGASESGKPYTKKKFLAYVSPEQQQ